MNGSMRSLDERRLREEKYGGTESPAFFADCERLSRGEPLAYVIGWQPFLGLRIYLDSRPLIPRPETEWWTEQLLTELKRNAISETLRRLTGRAGGNFSEEKYSVLRNRIPQEMTFLDLCAGSGAIGCAALKLPPEAKVYFGEIDPAHESTIRKNIRENGLNESRADIRIGDLFAPFAGMTFDVVAANPPYIPSTRSLEPSVGEYEPHQALFAGPDGLSALRRIALTLPNHLNPGGIAWIECDSSHIEAARDTFQAEGFTVTIRADQYGAPRVLVVSFP